MPFRQAIASLLVLGAGLSVDAVLADAQMKRSGTVLAVDVDKRSLTLEEIGLAGQFERHLVTLDPAVRVVEIARRGDSDAEGAGAWPGGFRETPARYLAPGDFVTVTLAGDAGSPVAVSIDVVRPEDGDSAAASPRPGPELPLRR